MSVYAVDVDGDGDVDVISAAYDSDTVAWYENDGSQAFTERIITTRVDSPKLIFAIDVDGDGVVDVRDRPYPLCTGSHRNSCNNRKLPSSAAPRPC